MDRESTTALTQGQFARQLVQIQPRITLFIRSMVFNASDVDDLVQNVAAKACERLDTYDTSRSFEAWMITLARYEVMAYLKKQQREKLVFDETIAERLADTVQVMSDRGELFTLDALSNCLSRMQGSDRELLKQRFEYNQSGQAMAKALNISGATVSRRLSHIYSQLLLCVRGVIRREASV